MKQHLSSNYIINMASYRAGLLLTGITLQQVAERLALPVRNFNMAFFMQTVC